MTVEMTAFGNYLGEGLELIESRPFHVLEGAALLVHLFDNRKLRGRVLRTEPARALVEIGERRWWLERNSSGQVGRWMVRAREGEQGHSCKEREQTM